MYTSKQWVEKMCCETWQGGGRFFIGEDGELKRDYSVPCTEQEFDAFFQAIEDMEERLWNEFSEVGKTPKLNFKNTEQEFCYWLEMIYNERYLGEEAKTL